MNNKVIPYGKQTLGPEDIEAVLDVLEENEYLTTGPRVQQFEQAVCQYTGAKYAVAVNSGTAALHAAMFAIDLRPGDEVIVPAMSFAASSNCVLYMGAKPIFCDIDAQTLNIDILEVEALITPRTRAIIAVDFAGQPPAYQALRIIAERNNIYLIADAAHSFGLPGVGLQADLTTFSFHPVKNITTGEGGMIVTDNEYWAKRMRSFRSHGIDIEYHNRRLHEYDMTSLGYNYRITDLQCALGLSQLTRVKEWLQTRQKIFDTYATAFAPLSAYFRPLQQKYPSAHHIYVIILDRCYLQKSGRTRDTIFAELKQKGLGVNVHYKPIYLHTYYQKLGYKKGLCSTAEDVYDRIITLPLFPSMTPEMIERVITVVKEIFHEV